MFVHSYVKDRALVHINVVLLSLNYRSFGPNLLKAFLSISFTHHNCISFRSLSLVIFCVQNKTNQNDAHCQVHKMWHQIKSKRESEQNTTEDEVEEKIEIKSLFRKYTFINNEFAKRRSSGWKRAKVKLWRRRKKSPKKESNILFSPFFLVNSPIHTD